MPGKRMTVPAELFVMLVLSILCGVLVENGAEAKAKPYLARVGGSG